MPYLRLIIFMLLFSSPLRAAIHPAATLLRASSKDKQISGLLVRVTEVPVHKRGSGQSEHWVASVTGTFARPDWNLVWRKKDPEIISRHLLGEGSDFEIEVPLEEEVTEISLQAIGPLAELETETLVLEFMVPEEPNAPRQIAAQLISQTAPRTVSRWVDRSFP
jgi:hypothetical protein